MEAPIAIRALQSARVLEVEWGQGHVSRYPYLLLRDRCECALCRDEWTGQRRDPGNLNPETLTIVGMETVGNYALRIRWSDGHDTGLYTWDRLLSLCSCTQCQKPKAGPEDSTGT
jgi:DUF971 family protein